MYTIRTDTSERYLCRHVRAQEYADVVGNLQLEFGDDEYMQYLASIPVEKTHAGYSIDKKGRDQQQIGRKKTTSDDIDAI